ncbi:tagatose 1,6-diphosphate aldolase [Izhakiella capsodis]|uniref:Tagatose-bisphosphate aldolase n=1 Tax=Izhakiella capsodis TaxID=1367852 RepID=A0A1I4W0X5_9GAMM|nr:tagatose-bisphosphate aldolase [Izhakiella capsodis]SFN06809.1 tagatose 1,6-diphosphate aldolase [Izhakiella capsodis]
MTRLTEHKKQAMRRLSNEHGVIAALAIDQRGALKKMIAMHKPQGAEDKDIIDFKALVSRTLTPYASSILLDPEYGLPAAKVRADNAGLLLAYEKTGYDASKKGRLPDLLDLWSAKRLKEAGADAVKFLLYYDIDEETEINDRKQAFIERLGAECTAEDIPFYLELVSYDATNADASSKAYAKVKPHKVNDMMKVFSHPRYGVDVLKVEVPVNMKYVEGYAAEGESVYTREQAAEYFKQQSEATALPFIFLSAGVSAELFQHTLRFAKSAGSTFNGVLCGRATWANGVEPFITQGEGAARAWLGSQGKANITELNAVLNETASSWFDKV